MITELIADVVKRIEAIEVILPKLASSMLPKNFTSDYISMLWVVTTPKSLHARLSALSGPLRSHHSLGSSSRLAGLISQAPYLKPMLFQSR